MNRALVQELGRRCRDQRTALKRLRFLTLSTAGRLVRHARRMVLRLATTACAAG